MDSHRLRNKDNLATRKTFKPQRGFHPKCLLHETGRSACASSRHSPRPRLSHGATKSPGICLVTRDVHTTHQWTHHLMVSGCQFPRLISLATFLSQTAWWVMRASGEAGDHELSFGQEWCRTRKKDRGGLKKRKEERQIEIFVLMFEGEWKQRAVWGRREKNKWTVWLGEKSRDWNREGWEEGVCIRSSLLSGLAASLFGWTYGIHCIWVTL